MVRKKLQIRRLLVIDRLVAPNGHRNSTLYFSCSRHCIYHCFPLSLVTSDGDVLKLTFEPGPIFVCFFILISCSMFGFCIPIQNTLFIILVPKNTCTKITKVIRIGRICAFPWKSNPLHQESKLWMNRKFYDIKVYF